MKEKKKCKKGTFEKFMNFSRDMAIWEYFFGYLVILPGLLGLMVFPITVLFKVFGIDLLKQNPDLWDFIRIIWMFISTYIVLGLMVRKLNRNKKRLEKEVY